MGDQVLDNLADVLEGKPAGHLLQLVLHTRANPVPQRFSACPWLLSGWWHGLDALEHKGLIKRAKRISRSIRPTA
ncbi:hypothetical protein D9M70_471590 [compost metagenome]